METLQMVDVASQHYTGSYFGPMGAVALSRKKMQEEMRECEAQRLELSDSRYQACERYVRSFYVSHISTLCSALVPALKAMKFWTAWVFLKELRKTVHDMKHDYDYEGLAPTEMEVLLSALTKAWRIRVPLWVSEDIVLLGHKISQHEKSSFATKMLAMARLSSRKEVPLSVRVTYREHVRAVVIQTCESNTDSSLSWETIARLASLIGLRECMCYAAFMDGRPDVLNKYGYSLANVVRNKFA